MQGLITLLAALLLERRVILVAKERDTVSAAVHAAAALLYPFRWQHIYLPLLPIALKVWHCRRQSELLHQTAEQANCIIHAVIAKRLVIQEGCRDRALLPLALL